MNINIEINDILLDDVKFSESQSLELRQALQSELAGVFASNPVIRGKSRSVSIGAARFQSATSSSPRELASGLANSIGQSMEKFS